MAYVENRTIHDADSHVMEFPETIGEFMSKEHLDQFKPFMRSRDKDWVNQMKALQNDPEYCSAAEREIMLRRGHMALGAFRKEDRPRALDYLGFTSQLMVTTDSLDNYGLETGKTNELACEAARAHNRMMTDFCSVDKRLLATGYVPLVDFDEAPRYRKRSTGNGL